MWKIVLVTAVLTVLAVLVLMNFHRPEKAVRHAPTHSSGIGDAQFRREMGALLAPAIVGGNAITALNNGDEIFPAMLAAIRSAQRSITFETYIYWSGDIASEFVHALVERARAGVAVHVMLDWAGSAKMDDDLLDELVDAGIEVEHYHPLRWYTVSRMNNRTHRKLLVVDGRIGFTGGVGIADQWTGNAQDPDHWRDIHFRIDGPVVAQLQAGFMDNWITTTGRVLQGEKYYPPLGPAGDMDMQMFVSSPVGGSASMRLMYLLAITAAQHSIDLQAAYFIPGRLVVDSLLAARERGVKIRLLLPGRYIDSSLVRIASRRRWGELLAAGVEIQEYEPTMMHNKLLIVDGALVSVGSTNFDMRSFDLNDEASLNIYSREFGRQMTDMMDADLRDAKPYTYTMWKQRPLLHRIGELLVRPLESQL